ncbi:hypothetical protein [Acetivibrio ethanolgignens]|uniref:Uncharacterized protein n=1 Tax=Acetivibrio ethanolgignens TaxID=290052 RepID=A0A0V8QFQ4_9FIRM|nr:hypothetical protein ASU35_09000 [Acetivibrio ethanolgignens]
MKIKKVGGKPMVIHTKKKAKIHIRRRKKASIKASSIYTVDRSPKIKGSKITTTENKKFRRSTIHPAPKAKNFSIKVAGAAAGDNTLLAVDDGIVIDNDKKVTVDNDKHLVVVDKDGKKTVIDDSQ